MRRRIDGLGLASLVAVCAAGLAAGSTVACGGRDLPAAGKRAAPSVPASFAERCNLLDDDGDAQVDEDFRDADGLYSLDAEHCGGCSLPCVVAEPALAVQCLVLDGRATCAETRCRSGYAPSRKGRCVPLDGRFCLPCRDDADCGDLAAAHCVELAGERRCSLDCSLGCPAGTRCAADRCVPESGSCSCAAGDRFELACAVTDPQGGTCIGQASCADGQLSHCRGRAEVCDGVDNDCDGQIDEEYRDVRGAYSVDLAHCGRCGVDCQQAANPEGLICGGDALSPSCVIRCADADDGKQLGDQLDADRDASNGCECTVASLDDPIGPAGAAGETLDTDCDGADGKIVESFFVAVDGDDRNIGSPTQPLRNIDTALQRAAASLATTAPRRHVFVASGTYTESLTLPDGVLLHGGYRRDFRALDSRERRVEVRAPVGSAAGVALRLRGAGVQETLLEGMTLIGSDAGESSPAFGMLWINPGPGLTMRQVEVRAGRGGRGGTGPVGTAGSAAMQPAGSGVPQRLALEDAATHRCLANDGNRVVGGAAGQNFCAEGEVHGGSGGSSRCPSFAALQESGAAGGGERAGGGGSGGQDAQGPIFLGDSCPNLVCCGPSDFVVPSPAVKAIAGQAGGAGPLGGDGSGCSDVWGRFAGEAWVSGSATAGAAGRAGSGGGGGGSGGGIVVDWIDGVCAWVDGLGGSGGGGGAGGCGGGGGGAGMSGGPSAAVVMLFDSSTVSLPTLLDNTFVARDGGPGGRAGAGGLGGLGGAGGQGGAIDNLSRNILPLGGAQPGQPGGQGGSGGQGGAGGGGCGGSSLGLWLQGRALPATQLAAWRSGNLWQLGRGGAGGQGGAERGSAVGAPGAEVDVRVSE